MRSKVTVRPSGRTFTCEGRQTLLEAALAASVSLGYGCSMGTCGLCKARLVDGKVERVRHADFALRESEKLVGDFLLCSCTAASPEIVIEATEAADGADIPWQAIDARIKKISRATDDIIVATVQTPRTNRFRFLAGQSLRLTLDKEVSSDLPIASCPCEDRNIEVHLRRNPGNAFAGELSTLRTLPVPVRVEGPWGRALFPTPAPFTLCLAFDTGMAPLRGWLEQQFTDDVPTRIELHWFAARPDDFYLRNLLSAWADAFDSFRFHLSTLDDPGQLDSKLETAFAALPDLRPGDARAVAAGPAWFTDRAAAKAERFGLTGAEVLVQTIPDASSHADFAERG